MKMVMEKYRKQKAYSLHVDHSQWLENLRYYTEELKQLKENLAGKSLKKGNSAMMKQIEHFQNQFVIQENEIAELKSMINEHERYIEKHTGHNPAEDRKSIGDHMAERDKMEIFEKLFQELKTDFTKFLSRTM